jgi:hypothetical protein
MLVKKEESLYIAACVNVQIKKMINGVLLFYCESRSVFLLNVAVPTDILLRAAVLNVILLKVKEPNLEAILQSPC